MPFPLALLPAIAAFAGNQQNSQAQRFQNEENRINARDDYERQKRDALEFWHMQNEYNSPANQMKRYEEAGLNPRLIYGQQNLGGHVSVPDLKTIPGIAPKPGDGLGAAAAAALSQHYDLEIKKQQVSNMKAQYDVIQEEAALKAAQQRATLATAGRQEFNLDFDSELREVSADARREELRQLRTNIDLSMNRDVREALKNTSDLTEALERIATMRIQRAKTDEEIKQIRETVQNLKKEGSIKDLEIELRRMGLGQNDPWYSRVVGRWMSEAFQGNPLDDVSTGFTKGILKLLNRGLPLPK